ncbi:MAG TPA: tetratricopeptide repeat protein [Flavobacterium sp.]|uniref:tetratricopeptide repeat protein n=1 Tax=Flavobacterium sp. TaxID=239 RepID=UPI001B6A149C|nr:tetratricopeptide repeat protein [Flavobacterium sp.]MBP6146056.1 tetratricopeptide repeat protein [Flavobacterium sp.]MBP7182610.1 tetratricopeptide repeat protein [Flavobacterium sp.]MBP7317152.1 tetratricopeptide repeat protein [Flavobacterium sp.]HRL70210.1 tetratricopeptide repeat protein [Flavobacterium sp.]HRM45147.1 tetratricopeptide repeat protein [Flavobacterium sp.]
MKKSCILMVFLVLQCNSALLWAQTEPEEIKLDTDQFQEFFYESLLQKGIENYDKAIVALEKAMKIKPNDATVYYELGKNYLALKEYKNAYNSFESATKIDPKNKWFWIGMYDVSYETKNFTQGITVINKLIEFDPKYKEDLTSLYMGTNQFEKALVLIQELDETYGKTDRRELYKIQILSQGKFQNIEITNLEHLIIKNPQEEANYISLIFLYSKNNEEAKAFETVQKLEKAIPNSEWAQVTLFKNYLDSNDAPKAIKAMNIVLASAKIDSKIKHRIVNEFLIFTDKNPQYSADLEKAVGYFDKDTAVDVAKEIGKFFHAKKQWDKAIHYYEKSVSKESVDVVETNLLLLQAHTEQKQFDIVAKKALVLIETFPTQPQFYYYTGLAYNQLQQFKKAKDLLEMGMDYVVENKELEINFNIQLGEAYNGLGDFKKKDLFFSKANQLLKEKK